MNNSNRWIDNPAHPRNGSAARLNLDRLAFVDLETSGTSPLEDRIVEIGVVLLDGDRVSHWSTLLDPRTDAAERAWDRPKYARGPDARPPRFQEIAATLAGLFEGRLMVAHNARFDYNFLRAEFARIGVAFEPPTVLCSVALSRKLYPECARHDLDAVAQRHGLTATVRHRALPDADLVRQFWECIRDAHTAGALDSAVADLTAAPVYPAHLDLALIDRLPEGPGIYVLHDAGARVLDAGAAFNLKRHVQSYFRLNTLTGRASAISHLVADIRWKTTRGPIGARLELVAMPEWRALHDGRARELHSWHFTPERVPAVAVRAFDSALCATGESYGVFGSLRRARNALGRLAAKRMLCLRVLGIAEEGGATCTRCAADDHRPPCMSTAGRLRELVRASNAMSESRNPAWPFAGPVGLRERGTIHVLSDWRYLGSAASQAELDAIVDTASHAAEIDWPMVRLIRRLLERYADRIVMLHATRETTQNM